MAQKKINNFYDNFQGYLELASGVVERAVKDFVQCGWKLKHVPEPDIKKGTKYCKYQETKRDFGTAKSFLEDPVGLIQEIFGADDVVIGSIQEKSQELIDKDFQGIGLRKVTLLLNQGILKIVNDYRKKLGLDKKDDLDESE